jgi:hypothetical protein
MVGSSDNAVKKVKNVKNDKFSIKKKETKSKTKTRKIVDPAKVNAAQALQRIAFTRVDDRFLMDDDAIQKDDLLKPFVGFDTPTTCQINLNYLFTKAITCMEKRMSAIEKQIKHLSPDYVDDIVGNKRKRACATPSIIDLDGGETKDGFRKEDKETQVCTPIEEKEPGEIDLVNESQAQEV